MPTPRRATSPASQGVQRRWRVGTSWSPRCSAAIGGTACRAASRDDGRELRHADADEEREHDRPRRQLGSGCRNAEPHRLEELPESLGKEQPEAQADGGRGDADDERLEGHSSENLPPSGA